MERQKIILPHRLSKFVAQTTGLSHRLVKQAYDAGKIVVLDEGERLPLALSSLVFDGDVVLFDGQQLSQRAPSQYWVLNKPSGFLSTTSDPHGRPSLSPWLADLPPQVFPVGRLDRATTGLMFLIDDGDLAYMLLKPDCHVDKVYQLTIWGRVESTDARLRALAQGIELEDGPAIAKSIRILSCYDEQTLIELIIDEGRNRQIRRMCKHVKLPLKHLHRSRVANVSLGDVELGEVRKMNLDEVEQLWAFIGGRELVLKRTLCAFLIRFKKGSFDAITQLRFKRWLSLNAHLDIFNEISF